MGLGGDVKAARAVWEAAVKGPAGRHADTWAAYVDFERRRGHTREARTLYKRCYRWLWLGGGCTVQPVVTAGWLRSAIVVIDWRFQQVVLAMTCLHCLLACLKVAPASSFASFAMLCSRKMEEGGQALLCDAWLRFEREEGRCGSPGCCRPASSAAGCGAPAACQ